ncbi:MAG: C10 family peptidase, partial [Candidatus Delongbacteria bacterium]|nr:C10 family peptidase [Candidatus Delongbacteria bacterium]
MVDALCKAKWDQVWPWNDLCPEKDGTWTYVGCVATAASMIMRYHEWPPTGTGSNTNSSAGTTETYSNYNFDYTVMNHVVDVQWGLYPTYWETVDMDAAAIQNMAELNYLTGHSFDMSYGTTADGGSGANMSASSTAFQAHWFYNTGYATVGTPTDPTYIASTIQGELDAKRPWWWAGGVHSFILDGYTDDYWYHFNWGWGGSQDGWFQITFLVPDGTGSGGGDGDYTASQIRISCLPNTDPFTAWPAPNSFNGSLANAEDVQLTWSAPTGGGQDSYNVFKSVNGDEATLLTNTTGTSYDDNDLVEGDYSYYVTAVYSDGESHNTDSYSTTVAPSLDYPVVRGLVCEAVGRTNIDLTWTDPFTGVILETTGFEDGGAFPAGWTIKTSSLLIKGDPKPPSFFADDTNGWVMITSKAVNPHIVLRPGEYCLIVSSAHTANCWILSPLLSLGPDTFIKFWTRFKGNPDTEQYPRFHIVEQTGVFDGRDSYANILSTYDADPASPEYVPWNDFEAEWEVPLSGLAGLDRCIGFEIEPSNNYYTMAFDDVLIGEYSGGVSGDPDGYEVYRNGSLATTISDFTVTNWSDTNFIDGQNDYYIRAMYPSGESLAKWTSATIDANPVPNDLTGVGSKGSADLSWYMPYHNAPKWYSYITPESCSSTVDDLDGPIVRRRTQFKAEDLGFYYPITLDSVAIGFYDWDEGNWGGDNTFTIRILTGGTSAWDDTVYTSGTLTAVHNEIFTHPLPTP